MNPARALYRWCFFTVGSSRPAALMRIGLALLILYRFDLGFGAGVRTYGPALAVPFYLLLAAMLFGYQARLATFAMGVLTLAIYHYFSFSVGLTDWYHHHVYLLAASTLLLSLAPVERSYSVDRWLALRRGRALPEQGNLYAHRLLAVQLVILYFFAFWDKVFIAGTNDLFIDFLNGNRLEAIFLYHYWGSGFPLGGWTDVVTAAMAIIVAVLELFLPLLLIQRFQKWLVLPGIALHVAFYVMLPLQTYSLTCILLYLSLFDANRIHAWLDQLGPQGARRAAPAGTGPV